jgi:hypothetical protein
MLQNYDSAISGNKPFIEDVRVQTNGLEGTENFSKPHLFGDYVLITGGGMGCAVEASQVPGLVRALRDVWGDARFDVAMMNDE